MQHDPPHGAERFDGAAAGNGSMSPTPINEGEIRRLIKADWWNVWVALPGRLFTIPNPAVSGS